MAGKRGNGEGSIYQRDDGRWCATATVQGSLGEEPKRKYVYGRTRAEVAGKLKILHRAIQQGLPVTDDRLTVGAFLTEWLERSARPRLKQSTFESYSSHTRLHLIPKLGNLKLSKLQPSHIERFMNESRTVKPDKTTKETRPLSPRTRQYLRAILRTALDDAENEGLVARNVAKLAKGPRVVHQEVSPLSPEETKKFIEKIAGDRLEALYILAMASGMRQGELLGLRWSDLDLAARELRVRQVRERVKGAPSFAEPKSQQSRRAIPLPEIAVMALERHRTAQKAERLKSGTWQDTGLVFTTPTGAPLDASTVSHRFQAALVTAELRKVRFHDLRHGYASFLIAAGEHPRVVMELMGHSQISLTMNTYSHVMPSMKQSAAAKLDGILGTGIGVA